jgi:hypothetical protein
LAQKCTSNCHKLTSSSAQTTSRSPLGKYRNGIAIQKSSALSMFRHGSPTRRFPVATALNSDRAQDHHDVALTSSLKLANCKGIWTRLWVTLWNLWIWSVDRRMPITKLHEIGCIHLDWGNVKLIMDSLVEAAGMLRCMGRDFFSLASSPPTLSAATVPHSLAASTA